MKPAIIKHTCSAVPKVQISHLLAAIRLTRLRIMLYVTTDANFSQGDIVNIASSGSSKVVSFSAISTQKWWHLGHFEAPRGETVKSKRSSNKNNCPNDIH